VLIQLNQCVDGKLPLHVAAVKGHCDIVTALLDAGADVNAADSDGDIAVHYAVFGSVTIASTLTRRVEIEHI